MSNVTDSYLLQLLTVYVSLLAIYYNHNFLKSLVYTYKHMNLISSDFVDENSCHIPYMEKFWREWKSKIWQIMSYLPKFSLQIFTYTLKIYLPYLFTVACSPNFSSPIAFTCLYGLPKFSLTKIFLYNYAMVASTDFDEELIKTMSAFLFYHSKFPSANDHIFLHRNYS